MKTHIVVMRASVVAIALLTIGCSPDQNAESKARAAVKGLLKDPPSARFKDAYVVRRPADANGIQTLAVCGIVDGKNGFGAYTGGSRYVVTMVDGAGALLVSSATIDDGDRRAALDGQETIFERVYWNPSCVDVGHPAMMTAQSDY